MTVQVFGPYSNKATDWFGPNGMTTGQSWNLELDFQNIDLLEDAAVVVTACGYPLRTGVADSTGCRTARSTSSRHTFSRRAALRVGQCGRNSRITAPMSCVPTPTHRGGLVSTGQRQQSTN